MRKHERLVACASRVYRAARALCPRAVRRQYGDDMQATFEALCRDAAARGSLAVVALLGREITDVAVASFRARRPAVSDVVQTFRSAGRAGLKACTTDAAGLKACTTPDSIHDRSPIVTAISQDVRYALRMLRRQPGFASIAVITLALGIGANTAVFTVVNGVLLRPLPYADPDRLIILLYGRAERMGPFYSPPNYLDVTAQSGVFTSHAAFNQAIANLTGRGDPERVQGADVTWPFFGVLGVTAGIGRVFTESDAATDPHVVVISDGFWRRQFGARREAIGATLQLDGRPYTVMGVAPPDVSLPRGAEFWRPLVFEPNQIAPRARGAQWISPIARLKPGITLEQANSAMDVVAQRLAEQFPLTNRDRRMGATLLHELMVRNVRPALLVLLAAVTLVLLIACGNVANLLLARAKARTREVAVRAALGAGRRRLIQQFLAESLVLGVAGGAAGLLVAFWCTRVLVALGPASIPRLADVAIDWRVLVFTAACAIATSVVFGLAPAIASTGGAVARFIVNAGRGTIGATGTATRKALVICEMAVAVVLLVGAGLLVRSYERLLGVHPGFSPDGVLTFHVALPEAKYPSADAAYQFTTAFIDRLRQQPGVEHAAAIMGLPFDTEFSISTSFRRGNEPDSADNPSAGMRMITPDYFTTMRIPLLAGRVFDARDDSNAPEVVVINEQAAKRFWPDENPIGRDVRLGVRMVSGVRSGPKRIIGIVGDVKYGGLDLGAPPEIYLPHAQHPVSDLTIAVRSERDPLAIVPAARAVLTSLDPELPLADIMPMTDLVGRSIAERRFTMLLLASFAGVAVALAAIGVYGLLAYVVTQRTAEIGVRLAMGAAPADVVRLFVREGATLTIVGVAFGLLAALAGTRLLTTLLFGVTATDAATFTTVATVLALVALVASYVPARRAAHVDPMAALRAD